MAAITLASASPPRKPHRKAGDGDRAAARAAERQLLLRYHRWGDLAAREELVKRFLPLARGLALRYAHKDEPLDDLVQVASLGLVKAIDRFDPDRGAKFTSYAAPTILGELKRHFRDKGWALRVPRALQERTLAVGRVTGELSKALGCSPKPREVAQALGCRVEEVLEAQEAAASYEAASLDAPTLRDDDEAASLVDLIGAEDPAYELVEDRYAIASMWKALPEVERKVIELRFMSDLTQREIGDRIGYSQMHVSRLLRRALSRLEDAAAAAALSDRRVPGPVGLHDSTASSRMRSPGPASALSSRRPGSAHSRPRWHATSRVTTAADRRTPRACASTTATSARCSSTV